MKRPRRNKFICRILIFTLLQLCWFTSNGWAEMLGTQTTQNQITREGLLNALQNKEAQQQLKNYGITQAEAAARINSLTDEEISELAEQVDQLRAGGSSPIGYHDGFLGMLLLIPFIGLGLVLYVIVCIIIGCCQSGGKRSDKGNDQETIHTGNSFPTTEVEVKICDPGMETCT